MACPLSAVLLLSPVVHPWYLLWILPIALLTLARDPAARWPWAFVVWSVTSWVAYLPRPHYLASGVWAEPDWTRWFEYLPVWAALAWAAWSDLRTSGVKQELDVALGALDARTGAAERGEA